MYFNQLGVPDYILQAVKGLGYVTPTEIQEKCIPLIMQGKDVIGKSQTGSGKTFAYGIPAINMVDKNIKGVQILIVLPTRELACQVCDELRKITSLTEDIKTVPIYGGSNMQRQIDALRKNAKIVVGTPGRLMDHLRRRTLKLNDLKMIVLDEADEMLNMGFKKDIETILQSVKLEHQTVMFSATMPDPILKITKEFMREPTLIEIGSKLQLVSTIKQNFVYHDKSDAIVKVINKYSPKVCIVFCDTIRMTEKIVKLLNKSNIKTIGLNGDMRQNERKRNISDFKLGIYTVMVGTDVAARGLDIKNVDLVINYDLPYDVEYYIHRIGRTGRAGLDGLAITLIDTVKQRKQLTLIEKTIKTQIPQILLDDDVEMHGDNSTESLAYKREPKNNTRSHSGSSKRSNGRSFGHSEKRSSTKQSKDNDHSFNKSKRHNKRADSSTSNDKKSDRKESQDFDSKSLRGSVDYSSRKSKFSKNKRFNKLDDSNKKSEYGKHKSHFGFKKTNHFDFEHNSFTENENAEQNSHSHSNNRNKHSAKSDFRGKSSHHTGNHNFSRFNHANRGK